MPGMVQAQTTEYGSSPLCTVKKLLTKEAHVPAGLQLGKPCAGTSFSSLASGPTGYPRVVKPSPLHDMRWWIRTQHPCSFNW